MSARRSLGWHGRGEAEKDVKSLPGPGRVNTLYGGIYMKRVLFLILIIFSAAVNAQSFSGFGIKGGVSLANHTWDTPVLPFFQDIKTKPGVDVRGFAEFSFCRYFSLEGEVGFVQKGSSTDYFAILENSPAIIQVNTKNTLNFLSVSLLGKFGTNAGQFSPYILAGPQYNRRLGIISIFDSFLFNNFKKDLFGYSVGAGTEINNILPLKLLVEYRYERDITDNHSHQNLDTRNYSHSIMLGIKF